MTRQWHLNVVLGGEGKVCRHYLLNTRRGINRGTIPVGYSWDAPHPRLSSRVAIGKLSRVGTQKLKLEKYNLFGSYNEHSLPWAVSFTDYRAHDVECAAKV